MSKKATTPPPSHPVQPVTIEKGKNPPPPVYVRPAPPPPPPIQQKKDEVNK